MIILDTNVLSEMMRPEPSPAVHQWLDAQDAETLYLTSITIAELLFGVAALPSGKRSQRLSAYVQGVQELFSGRVLPFDLGAAQQHATLAMRARKQGHGFPIADGYIAAIAAHHGYAIATRDAAPFASVGLSVIDPWMS